jgi:hypothetical protein
MAELAIATVPSDMNKRRALCVERLIYVEGDRPI